MFERKIGGGIGLRLYVSDIMFCEVELWECLALLCIFWIIRRFNKCFASVRNTLLYSIIIEELPGLSLFAPEIII